jgi:hypothetical protein
MPGPDGFSEEPQSPLAPAEDDEAWDEAVWGPQKTLTAEEQAEYDAWFRRKVQEGLDYIRRPDAIFHTQEEVEAMMEARLEERIAQARGYAD